MMTCIETYRLSDICLLLLNCLQLLKFLHNLFGRNGIVDISGCYANYQVKRNVVGNIHLRMSGARFAAALVSEFVRHSGGDQYLARFHSLQKSGLLD